MIKKLLIINTGSTSTKIALYENEISLFVENIKHSAHDLGRYTSIYDQLYFRKDVILRALKNRKFNIEELDAVVSSGGYLKPLSSGTYIIDNFMIDDFENNIKVQDAYNLGLSIAYEISKSLNIPAYTVDPVSVDEMDEIARVSGFSYINRRSSFHALNQKVAGRRYADEHKKKYEDLNLIVAHMGGGISVGAHRKGKVVDVNNILEGEGPFSVEKAGALPIVQFIKLCYSGKYTLEEIEKKISGRGGLVAYLNTNDMKEIDTRIKKGDKEAALVFRAMAYQIAKEIGKCASVLCGKVDAIILTGGIAYDKFIINEIKERVGFISHIVIYPGENEMLELASGALRVIRGEEIAKSYETS